MKTNTNIINRKIIGSCKKAILLLLIILSISQIVSGASITARASGYWNAVTTWNGGIIPTSGDDVTIGSTFTVTLNVDAACNNLTLTRTIGTNLAIGNYTLTVGGTLNGPNTIFTNTIISTGTGRLKFSGNGRSLIGSSWSSSSTTVWTCEIALNNGEIGTTSSTVKFGDLTVTSGTLQLSNYTICKNLTLLGTTGTRLAIDSDTLEVNGTLNGPDATFSNNIITVGPLGLFMFKGSARALFGANWSTNYPTPWSCEVNLTSSTLVGTTTTSIKFGNITVTSGNLTLSANSSCNNLKLAGTSGTRLTIGTNTFDVSGTLDGPSNVFTNNLITTGVGGKLKFTGSGRELIGSNWSVAQTTGWTCEIALNVDEIGISTSGVKFGDLTVSSGTLNLSVNSICKNLTLLGTVGTRLDIGSNTLSVSGTLNGPDATFTNDIISTSTGGVIKFIGGTRALFGTNWSTNYPTPWNCEVSLTSSSYIGTTSTGIKFGDLTVTLGNLTLSANASCNNLTLFGTSGTRCAIGTNVFTVFGTLNGPNSTFTNNIITTGVGGKLLFPGNGRVLIGSNWSTLQTNGWACEVALNDSEIGTLSSGVKFGDLTITSGTLQLSSKSICKNLTLLGTTGTRLAVGSDTICVSGTLNGPDATFANDIISFGAGGLLQFIGGSGRALIGTNWSTNYPTLWDCEVKLNYPTYIGTTSTIIKFRDLRITSGNLRLSANASCNNLTLAGTTGTRLTIGTNNFEVGGTLEGPNTNFTNNLITTSTGGKLLFTGTGRTLIGSNWSSAYTSGWSCEVNLNENETGIALSRVKFGNLTVTSGTLQLTENSGCTNLTLLGTTGTRLAIGSDSLTISGVLNGPDATFSNEIITFDAGGLLKFIGNSKTFMGTNWSINYPSNLNIELNLTLPTYTGTINKSLNFGNITVTSGILRLLANTTCNNLTLLGTTGTNLNIGNYLLDVSGTLTGPEVPFSNNIISTGTGRLRFIGDSRVLFATNWIPDVSGTTWNWRCEVALNNAQIGTSTNGVQMGNLILTSGTLQVGSIAIPSDLRIDGGLDGSGTSSIATGANLIVSNNMGLRSTVNTYCGAININGKLTFQGTWLNGTININNGGVLEIKRIDPISSGILSFPNSSNFTYANGSTLLYNPEGAATSILTGAEISQTIINNGLNTLQNITADNGAKVSLSNSISCNDITSLNAANFIVQPGKSLTSNGTASFSNPLVLKSSVTAFRPILGTFFNNGPVIGNITMELSYTSTGSSASGTGRGLYFASPITNATAGIFNVAAGSNLLWYQDETIRQYVKITSNSTALTVAKGYILRTPTSNVFSFTGVPNTATSYTISNIPRAVTGQFYLVGNPYPTVIDWQTIATKTNLTNTIWYNTSTTDGTMVVDTWNGLVGTNNNGTAAVDGKIPPMQSFWVQCDAVGSFGTLTIASTDRTNDWGSTPFLKSPALNPSSTSNDLIRLYLYTKDKSDETIILQSESADDKFDRLDSRKMLLNDPNRAEIFTLSPEENNLAIQSIKPINGAKHIPVGMSIGSTGEYRFVANLAEFSNSSNIFLEDKLLNITQDLNANPEYIFKSEPTEDISRFVIHLLPAPIIITNTSISACSSGTIDLTSMELVKGSDPELYYTYWTDADAKIPYLDPTQATSGVYYIKGTSKAGAYKVSGPISVIVNPVPTIITNNYLETTSLLPIDLTSSEITLGSTEGLVYTYWTDPNASNPYLTPQVAAHGEYYIKGTVESTGCYNIAGPIKVNYKEISPDITDNSIIYSLNNQIHVVNFELNSTITMYDIIGNQILNVALRSSHEIINGSFKPGIYIVKVSNSKGIKSKKIFI